MKKVFPTILVMFLLLFLTSFNASATENKIDLSKMEKTANENFLFDVDTLMYFDIKENGYVDEIYRIENGKVVEVVSPEQYINIPELNSIDLIKGGPKQFSDLLGHMPMFFKNIIYYETRTTGSRISIIQVNPGPGTDTFLSSTHHSSTSINLTPSMEISAGYSGYWRFDSIKCITQSTIITFPAGVRFADIFIRVFNPYYTSNSQLDGWLVAVKNRL